MRELAKTYNPHAVEEKLYAQWLESGLFHADPTSPNPPFSIVIPPPNVTGILTLGHVLNNTIQDILCRRARMKGYEVLWLPGTDHAGLATQTVVEKQLKFKGLRREDLGREAFIEKVWQWKEKHGGIIIKQLKKLGCSCDWSRECFTLDPDYSRQVLEAFVTLFHRGFIYRGKRMVNWCPASLTAISDEEVVPTEWNSTLYIIRYAVHEEPGRYLEIATTRPETLMGDTAVAVHPADPRYRDLIGKHCVRPFPEALIPIIADEALDMSFGTGVLKVTPAHDRTDFEIGQRHHLPIIDVLHPDGRIHCPEVPELDGLGRFKARVRAAEMLAERGLLIREEPYRNTIGFSERGKVPIEPRLSEQWFLRYPKTEEALRVVREKLIRFHPSHHERVYQNWLDHIQDWCISRQIWWGHRIPVWYRGAEMRCQIECPGEGWEQDPDVLDTWASSWLWAYATMDKATRKKFYPTSVLVTGPDIIFLWVARMIIAGLEFEPSGQPGEAANIPFRDVFFTGLIRDSQGRKMSKSLGNSPDPLALIERYGADGLRFGLMRIAPQGQDIRFDEKQIEEGRNFCNKLWNACRFRAMQGPVQPDAHPLDHPLSPAAAHALEGVERCLRTVDSLLEEFQLSQAAATLYAYVWDDFCSRFVEAAKFDFRDEASPTRSGTLATMDYILSRILRLLHPYAPFVTETLWLDLGFGSETIQTAPWPQPNDSITTSLAPLSARAQAIYDTVDAGRSLRGEFKLPSNQKISFILRTHQHPLPADLHLLGSLLNASQVIVQEHAPARTPMQVTPMGDLFLPLEGLLDPEKERARLEKELAKARAILEREEKKLANPDMLKKAPAEKVADWHRIAAEARQRLAKIQSQLSQLT